MYKTATRIVVSLIVGFMVMSLIIPAFAAPDSGGRQTTEMRIESVDLHRSANYVIKQGNTVTPDIIVILPNISKIDGGVTASFVGGSFFKASEDVKVEVSSLASSSLGGARLKINLSQGNGLKYSGNGKDIELMLLFRAGGVDYTATVPYTVSQCVENGTRDPDDPDKPDIDPLTPYIIVENYTYGGTNVTAGNEFTLRVTLKNTSDTHTLQNIKMSVSPKGVFSMVSSSNTFYIDSLFAGSTTEKTITLFAGLTSVTDAKDANSIGIDFDFQYVVNNVRKSGTSNENITIPVLFPDRFEYTEPSMPVQVFVGEEFPIYIPIVNKGRSTVYNLSAELIGMESEQGQKLYIGNVNAGSENSIEFYVRPNMPGESDGKVVISYEDANMNLKEISIPFKVDVQEMSFPEPIEPPINPELPVDGGGDQGKSSKKAVMGLSFVAIAGMSAYVTIQKTKLKRREWDDEAI